MLTNLSVNAAETVAKSFKARGLSLSAKEDTVLSTLNSTAIGAEVFLNVKHQGSIVDLSSIITDSKAAGPDGGSEHCAVQEELVNRNCEVLTGLMGLVRSDLMGTTKEIIEDYDIFMNAAALKISEPFALIPNTYHRIWGSNQLFGYVERFENTPFVSYRVSQAFPNVATYDLLAMMKTGVASIDALITEWVEDQPDGKLMSVWENVFISRVWHIGRQTGSNHVSENGMDRNDNLMAFFIANGMEKAMPNELNMSLDTLRLICSEVRSGAGRVVTSELKRRETDIRRNNLVYTVKTLPDKYNPDGKRTVFVNNDVYQKFLEEGGSTESIYGAILNGGKVEYDAIKGNQPFLEGLYLKTLKLYNQQSKSVVFNATKDCIRMAFTKYVNSATEEQLPAGKGEVHSVMQKCVSNILPIDTTDIPVLIRDLVCDVLFCDTNAKMFLTSMDVAEIENPDLNPREYALLAFIDLQARWVSDQIKTKKSLN
jgi:hypothetical protein